MPYTIPSYTVSPGSVYQPKKSKPILDQISGAIAAWSTRRLISTAPADIARGRDASTNEQDFTAAELAGSGFTDLAGAGDGFYVTLYDQIGSNNATQVTAANQPKGVSAGALITDGAGVPVLRFNGLDSKFDASNQTLVKSVFCRFKSSDNKFILGSRFNTTRFFLAIEAGSGLALSDQSGANIKYYKNADLKPFTTRDDAYNEISIGQFLTVAVTGLDLSSYTTGLSFFYSGLYLTNFMSGDVTDIITFDHDLTVAEISQLHTALI